MLTVEGIIGDLLLQHNCVIVPSFGGFVAQRVGAQLDAVNGTMTPPRKAILFNRQLINNDGLLISSYAHQNKVEYNAAQAAVNETITHWEETLKQGQRISIDRVGFLYFDHERNLCFEQDRFYNLLMESYGLGAIHFVSAADVEAKIAHEAVQEMVREALTAPVVEVEFRPSEIETVEAEASDEAPVIPLQQASGSHLPAGRRGWRYVAAAALLPIAFYSFWIPMKTDVLESGMLSLSDFNPFHKTAPTHYKAPAAKYDHTAQESSDQLASVSEDVSVFSFSIDDDWFIPVRIREGNTAVPAPEAVQVTPEPQPVAQPTSSSSGSHVIVGCFSSRANAENLAKSLRTKGFDAQTLEGKGLIRVSAGDGAQFSSLQPKLQAEGLQGWVLK
jgi:hypothetical protein